MCLAKVFSGQPGVRPISRQEASSQGRAAQPAEQQRMSLVAALSQRRQQIQQGAGGSTGALGVTGG